MPGKSRTCLVFVLVFGLGMVWGLYTNHAWEDYYITYRASKNLATGQGLTFTAGERVHSFTSPLGVLLPALASALTGNKSDQAALWIFRLMSCGALGAAAVLLWQFTRTRFSLVGSSVMLVAFFAADAKIVDFSTNGMETAFLLLFLVWSLKAGLTPNKSVTALGLAWAGLLWTRPDSFIYIGALGGAIFLFPSSESRWSVVQRFCRAGALALALYLPWFFWAWSYYGSPVPNTIVAKGLFSPGINLSTVVHWLLQFPRTLWVEQAVPTSTFMPAYSFNTGWPVIGLRTSFGLSLLALVIWLLPRVRQEARIASLIFAVGQFYLTSVIRFPTPWYLPATTLFAFVALASVADQLVAWSRKHEGQADLRRVVRVALPGLVLVLLGGELTISAMAAYQLKWQQSLIENQQRKAIGLFLREQSPSPRSTVFLEPLGYIGFFSGLKMLDYPGLSSKEMIHARRRAHSSSYPDCWPELILDLQPDWLVMRPYESESVHRNAPDLFSTYYELAKTFDVRDRVAAVPHLEGRGYLINDAVFEVYRRKFDNRGGTTRQYRLTVEKIVVNENWHSPAYYSGDKLVAHAPSRLVFKAPPRLQGISGGFGMFEGAYDNAGNRGVTDGAEFIITAIETNGTRHELLRRLLTPAANVADRGTKDFEFSVSNGEADTIELAVSPGPEGNNAFDWSYWDAPMFRTEPQ